MREHKEDGYNLIASVAAGKLSLVTIKTNQWLAYFVRNGGPENHSEQQAVDNKRGMHDEL